MPTPVGHSLAGLAVHLTSPRERGRERLVLAAFLIGLANLPDIDLVPGYFIGEPRAFHWGATHSLFAALCAGLVSGSLARWLDRPFAPFFALATAAYGSHIVLDLLLGPGAPSIGLQVLWPFSTERFMAPWSVFRMLPGSIEQLGPLGALFSRGALPLIRRELMILVPVCLAFWAFGRYGLPAVRASQGDL